ncbi:MAG TPA: hypothetical protein VMF59_14770, partial [Bacteroidota bacterium]|nr:hypothetical protein [Bacteroidota bacterium]
VQISLKAEMQLASSPGTLLDVEHTVSFSVLLIDPDASAMPGEKGLKWSQFNYFLSGRRLLGG